MNKYRIKFRQLRYGWIILYAMIIAIVWGSIFFFIPQLLSGALGILVSVIILVGAYIGSSEIHRRL